MVVAYVRVTRHKDAQGKIIVHEQPMIEVAPHVYVSAAFVHLVR